MNLTIDNLDFHQLVENSLNSILIVCEDQTIRYCNKAGLHLLNLPSLDQILNKKISQFLPPNLHDMCNEGLTRVKNFIPLRLKWT
ncbi:PAS domain-containing protein [Bacillus sp. OV166]|uniref:PAS domain-containing protein n=1 Tax=Bacillus sp. OV166 TaxID=1882763 RepID=UPI000B4527C4